MQSKAIRKKFLEFFEKRDHKIVPSAPLVTKDDPSLMFINAGMNQFKDAFLGNKKPPKSRVTDTQKCLRVSGKHNDLEEVGLDTYHHTFFEMLGNWSFGDYFKQEAIDWAWELLTQEFGIAPEQLYASVFGGDKADGLEADLEAEELWKNYLPKERILHAGKEDNFWEMGDTGPCGPCTEIHIDIRPEEEREQTPGSELVNQDHPQVIEIWNVVFIQFNRMANGSLQPLKEQHVDTGMGFERLCMVLQGKTSNYDTDVFTPLLDKIGELAGTKYGKDKESDIAMRVIADHIRAVAFVIGDGQMPSNTGAGYVIRRILRRAIRYGYTFLELKEPFFHKLLPVLSGIYAEPFPELKEQADFIEKTIFEEEKSFLSTLETGIKLFEAYIQDKKWNNRSLEPGELEAWSHKEVPGHFAFELFDTFGFPLDLTDLLAREKGFSVDLKGFDTHMAAQKARSRSAAATETGDWTELLPGQDTTFKGYEHLETRSQIVKYRPVKKGKKTLFQVVLDQTPFYAESGGQVGDKGILRSKEEEIKVVDTQKENELTVHFVDRLPEHPEAEFEAIVEAQQRQATANNHTATHLLHAALREILGKHVQQKGSLVSPRLLRFDFSHPEKLSEEEVEQIEKRVNEKIREDVAADIQIDVPLQEAKEKGAMALFGEKYAEHVRVVTFDPNYSIELCGGTHVQRTGQIGFFKLTSEGSVSAGVRRIEALTGPIAEEFVRKQNKTIDSLKQLLKSKGELVEDVQKLLDEKASLGKTIERMEEEKTGQIKAQLIQNAQEQEGLKVIIQRADFPNADAPKKLAFEFKQQFPNLFLVLAGTQSEKPFITIMLGDEAKSKTGLHAGKSIREWAKHIKGGGGGQDFFAMAGGSDPSGIEAVLEEAKQQLQAVAQGG